MTPLRRSQNRLGWAMIHFAVLWSLICVLLVQGLPFWGMLLVGALMGVALCTLEAPIYRWVTQPERDAEAAASPSSSPTPPSHDALR